MPACVPGASGVGLPGLLLEAECLQYGTKGLKEVMVKGGPSENPKELTLIPCISQFSLTPRFFHDLGLSSLGEMQSRDLLGRAPSLSCGFKVLVLQETPQPLPGGQLWPEPWSPVGRAWAGQGGRFTQGVCAQPWGDSGNGNTHLEDKSLLRPTKPSEHRWRSCLLPVKAEGSGVPQGGPDSRKDVARRHSSYGKGEETPPQPLWTEASPEGSGFTCGPVYILRQIHSVFCTLVLRLGEEEAEGRRITRRRCNPILSHSSGRLGPRGRIPCMLPLQHSPSPPPHCLFLHCPSLSWGGTLRPPFQCCCGPPGHVGLPWLPGLSRGSRGLSLCPGVGGTGPQAAGPWFRRTHCPEFLLGQTSGPSPACSWLPLTLSLSTRGLWGTPSQRLAMEGRVQAWGLPLCPLSSGAQSPHGLGWVPRWPCAETNVLRPPAAWTAPTSGAGRSACLSIQVPAPSVSRKRRKGRGGDERGGGGRMGETERGHLSGEGGASVGRKPGLSVRGAIVSLLPHLLYLYGNVEGTRVRPQMCHRGLT